MVYASITFTEATPAEGVAEKEDTTLTTARNDYPETAYGTNVTDYRVLQSAPDYSVAQEIVDRLSDRGFPVERVRIVGSGLRSIEQVTGRMTTGKAAGRGALAGLWFGLLLAILFLILAPLASFLWILVWSLGFGALWGALFGAIGHASTGGRRDFSSVQTMEADSYDVLVESTHLDEAVRLIGGPAPRTDLQR
ncbi:general stress protein [Dietzia sp. E1]|uniref:general stress protein n=1 Tax=Dietzia sp. E1 TaxID=328361 RepID=UPI001F509E1E|nr:general stress protein [Dietzia sp. E1]